MVAHNSKPLEVASSVKGTSGCRPRYQQQERGVPAAVRTAWEHALSSMACTASALWVSHTAVHNSWPHVSCREHTWLAGRATSSRRRACWRPCA